MSGRTRQSHLVVIVLVLVSVPPLVAWLICDVLLAWKTRTDVLTAIAFAEAVGAGLATVVATRWPSAPRPLGSKELADGFAEEVLKGWRSEAARRDLLASTPIPVRWVRSKLPVAGPLREAVGRLRDPPRFAPLPGFSRASSQRLSAGRQRDLLTVYGGLQSGRLLIVGEPGAGKTAAAILLVLDALEHRRQLPDETRQSVPVPVLMTVRDWNPRSQRVEQWLARRLAETYPAFGGRAGLMSAQNLIVEGRVALFLDGLDEMPSHLRADALRAINRQAVFRVIVLTRTTEMLGVAGKAHLVGAAAIELQSVAASGAADYLQRVQLDPPPVGWLEFTKYLRAEPNGALAEALASPLMLTLIRDTYLHDGDVRDLLRIARESDDKLAKEDIQNHLLDRVITTAYMPQPGDDRPRYDAEHALRTLRYIADRMEPLFLPDFEWWYIRRWAPRLFRVTVTLAVSAIAIAIPIGASVGLLFGPLPGFIAAAVTVPGVALGRIAAWEYPWRERLSIPVTRRANILNIEPLPRHVRLLEVPASTVGALALIGVCVGAGLVLLLKLVIARVTSRDALPVFPYVPAVALAFGILWSGAAALGFSTGVADSRDISKSPLGPEDVWRADLISSVKVAGIIALVGGVFLAAFVAIFHGGTSEVVIGALLGSIGFALSSITYFAWWWNSLAFLQLARTRGTPRRLMRFLEDARRRDVLRTVGPVYQFRHARLQDRLLTVTSPTSVANDASVGGGDGPG